MEGKKSLFPVESEVDLDCRARIKRKKERFYRSVRKRRRRRTSRFITEEDGLREKRRRRTDGEE